MIQTIRVVNRIQKLILYGADIIFQIKSMIQSSCIRKVKKVKFAQKHRGESVLGFSGINTTQQRRCIKNQHRDDKPTLDLIFIQWIEI